MKQKTTTKFLKIGGHRRDGKRIEMAEVDQEIFEKLEGKRYTVHSAGYAYRWETTRSGRKIRYLHRDVMALAGHRIKGFWVDHINGNKLDNRLENLRLVSPSENAQNVRHNKRKGSSVFRGVSKTKSGWRVTVRGYSHGIFEDEIEAALKAHQVRCDVMPFAEVDPELARVFGNNVDQGYQMRIPGF